MYPPHTPVGTALSTELYQRFSRDQSRKWLLWEVREEAARVAGQPNKLLFLFRFRPWADSIPLSLLNRPAFILSNILCSTTHFIFQVEFWLSLGQSSFSVFVVASYKSKWHYPERVQLLEELKLRTWREAVLRQVTIKSVKCRWKNTSITILMVISQTHQKLTPKLILYNTHRSTVKWLWSQSVVLCTVALLHWCSFSNSL